MPVVIVADAPRASAKNVAERIAFFAASDCIVSFDFIGNPLLGATVKPLRFSGMNQRP